jgi:hypothetical protein
MPNPATLDPQHRMLYVAGLQPPPGYVFDAAVATTYSLEFETALAVPVSLALFAAEDRDELQNNPLALLEGAERIAGRVLVFLDAGHIQAHLKPHSRLCSLLERILVEVAAPKKGAFHPKLWVLRFTPFRAGEPVRMRLLMMSRNLTRDRSWDAALSLDGVIKNARNARNRPLVDLLKKLPGLATAGVPEGAFDLVDALAEDLRRTEWSLPQSFDKISFAVNGLGGEPWRPESCVRMGVVSPFCDEETLSMLADLTSDDKPLLLGRSDQLAVIPEATLGRFANVSVLDERASEDDREDPDANTLQGLHAKLFVAERGWDTSVTVGSGNATRPALLTGSNVEAFATLTGKRSRVGSVENILGPNGFGRLTRPFVASECTPADAMKQAAESRLELARREICRSGLRLRCERAEASDDGTRRWRICLLPPEGAGSKNLALAGLSSLRVWPITRGDGHACDVLEPLRSGAQVNLGDVPLTDVTRFLACRLVDQESGVPILFTTGLPLEGLPPERNAAILHWAIQKKGFLSYLRLLLAEMGDPFTAMLQVQHDAGQGAWNAFDDEPILEEMTRAFCKGGSQMQAIQRLMSQLETVEPGEEDLVPPEFKALWNTFRIALKNQEAAREG